MSWESKIVMKMSGTAPNSSYAIPLSFGQLRIAAERYLNREKWIK